MIGRQAKLVTSRTMRIQAMNPHLFRNIALTGFRGGPPKLIHTDARRSFARITLGSVYKNCAWMRVTLWSGATLTSICNPGFGTFNIGKLSTGYRLDCRTLSCGSCNLQKGGFNVETGQNAECSVNVQSAQLLLRLIFWIETIHKLCAFILSFTPFQ